MGLRWRWDSNLGWSKCWSGSNGRIEPRSRPHNTGLVLIAVVLFVESIDVALDCTLFSPPCVRRPFRRKSAAVRFFGAGRMHKAAATRPTKVEFIFFYRLMLRPVVAVSFTPILRSSDAFGQRDFATPFGLRASATPAHLRICWLRPVVHIR
jgi:hypothetical protein